MLTSEFCESSNHEFFHVNTLLLGDSRGQTESLDGSSNTNSDVKNTFLKYYNQESVNAYYLL